jgi:preprotein translocase subunit SecB
MKPPLSLDLSYPTLIHVVSEPEGSCDAGYDVECDLRVGQNTTQERRWRVELRVRFGAKSVKQPAYKCQVTYVGIFTVADDYPKEKMYRLIGVDAPSILYSSIRELVALLTGRGATKTVILPTVSFIENVVVPPDQSPAAGKPNEAATPTKARGAKMEKRQPTTPQTKATQTLAKAVKRG